MMIISLLGIIYGSLVALRQTDLKKMIAYASISHMNLVTLGLFTVTNTGISGAISYVNSWYNVKRSFYMRWRSL